MKYKPKDKTFHYTDKQMVKDLISITPLSGSVLDAGSGKNKVWYKNIPDSCKKYECEIEDGVDFFKWNRKVDWVIGNPPYHISWRFTEKAKDIANIGIAWLVNNLGLNSLFTPRRLRVMNKNGFKLQHIHVVADKRWFGRYYYLIFTKKKNNFVSWECKTY